MQIYLVGGAVRDQLLKRSITERDWVVVGATAEEMLTLGYKKVGRDFPVFLHPETHEEYALARTERKTGRGYTAFACDAAPTVTLQEDLQRRDLTINAIAQAPDGTLIDPYGGIADLRNRVLRHVSAAFVEDPLRVLRVARFAATFAQFTIHPTTRALMQQIAGSDELEALVPERVWQEMARALATDTPARFFVTLRDCDALPHLFPEIATHFKPAMATLERATKMSNDASVRFAALMGNFPVKTVLDLNKRYRIPRVYSELAKLVIRHKDNYLAILTTTTPEILNLLEALDVFRNPARTANFVTACESLAETDVDFLSRTTRFKRAYEIVKQVDVKALVENLSPTERGDGKAIKAVIHSTRLEALEQALN